MIELGQHAEFIVLAYLGVFGGLGLLIGLTVWSARRTARRLAQLEAAREARQS